MTQPDVDQTEAAAPVPPSGDVPATATPEQPRSRSRVLPWLTGLLGVLLIASLVGLGITVNSLSDRKARDAAASAARTQAITYATKMATYSYKTFDQDFSWMATGGTDAWRRQYQGTVNDTLKQVVVTLKENASGKVSYAAANLKDTKHVTVLLFVDQTLTSDAKPGSNVSLTRVVMQMVKQNGTWLVDDIQAV